MSEAPTELRIHHESPAGATAQELINELDDELQRRYPDRSGVPAQAEEAFTALHDEEVAPGRGAFLIASVGPIAAGCGAVRRIEPQVGELKRMFVRPEFRGRGVASALIVALEAEAKELGITRVVLEVATFSRDAIALYAKHGYRDVPLFGPYVGSPISTAMAKELGDRG